MNGSIALFLLYTANHDVKILHSYVYDHLDHMLCVSNLNSLAFCVSLSYCGWQFDISCGYPSESFCFYFQVCVATVIVICILDLNAC